MPFVQAATGTGTGTSLAVTLPANVGAGSLIVVGVTKNIGTDDTASDVLNGAYTAGPVETDNTDGAGASFYRLNSAAGSVVVTATGGGSMPRAMVVAEYSLVALTAALDKSAVSTGFGTAFSSGNMGATVQADETIIGVGFGFNSAADPVAAGANFTIRASLAGDSNKVIALEDREVTSTGVYAALMTAASNCNWAQVALAFKRLVIPVTIDQEGFRWRNDDGTEATATWKAAQDTTVSLAPGDAARLRMLINATSDPASRSFKLQYRKVGAAGWRNIDMFE